MGENPIDRSVVSIDGWVAAAPTGTDRGMLVRHVVAKGVTPLAQWTIRDQLILNPHTP